MGRIVLISCASKKLPHRAKAQELYISPLFRLSLKYAHSLKPNNIFILSAKHGLVELNEELDSYNETLMTKSNKETRLWAEDVSKELRLRVNLEQDEIVFLAGEKYRRHLIPHCKQHEVPLEGLRIGEQLQFLQRKLSR